MRWEQVGSGAAVVCGIHCLVFPFLAGFSAIASLPLLHSEWFETGLLALTGLIGFSTLGPSFRRHGRPLPLTLLLVGLASIASAHALLSGPLQAAGAAAGALLILTGQRLDRGCQAPCCISDPRRLEPAPEP